MEVEAQPCPHHERIPRESAAFFDRMFNRTNNRVAMIRENAVTAIRLAALARMPRLFPAVIAGFAAIGMTATCICAFASRLPESTRRAPPAA